MKNEIGKVETWLIYNSGSQSGRYRPPGGGETEMGGWGAIEDQVNNYISVVLLTLSDQMS